MNIHWPSPPYNNWRPWYGILRQIIARPLYLTGMLCVTGAAWLAVGSEEAYRVWRAL